MPGGADGRPPAAAGLGRLTRLFHWLTALLVLMVFGLAVLMLTVGRLGWRALRPLPPGPPRPRWEAWLAGGVQVALLLSLLAQPLLGWASSSAQGDTVTLFGLVTLPALVEVDDDVAARLFGAHRLVGFAILGLVGLHVAGALRHGLIKRDGVLRRTITGQALP